MPKNIPMNLPWGFARKDTLVKAAKKTLKVAEGAGKEVKKRG